MVHGEPGPMVCEWIPCRRMEGLKIEHRERWYTWQSLLSWGMDDTVDAKVSPLALSGFISTSFHRYLLGSQSQYVSVDPRTVTVITE